MNLVDLPRVEQAAQQAAAPFDQHVGQPPPAQFGQQRVEPRGVRLALADEHLAAGVAKPRAVGRR